jgi:drug/metabolite transporter superfamily protein YnfA
MTNQSSGITSLVGGFLSWIVREHCARNPEAVAKAWEQMNAEAPTLADAGRMFAAYGADFTIAELRYIAQHPEALRLARNAAAGRQYLDFNESTGFRAEKTFVPPAPQSVRPLVVPMILTVLGLVLSLIGLLADNLKGAAILGALTAILLLVTLVEFAEIRSRHRARRAIEQSSTADQPGPQTVPAPPARSQNS